MGDGEKELGSYRKEYVASPPLLHTLHLLEISPSLPMPFLDALLPPALQFPQGGISFQKGMLSYPSRAGFRTEKTQYYATSLRGRKGKGKSERDLPVPDGGHSGVGMFGIVTDERPCFMLLPMLKQLDAVGASVLCALLSTLHIGTITKVCFFFFLESFLCCFETVLSSVVCACEDDNG
jgi:hypothetical protein